jgi:SAM-dependent methyltransferase
VPKKVAEIGPGDSLGTGLAAMISGVDEYYAFDVVKYFNVEKNLKVFDELVKLFESRVPLPDDKEFPRLKPCLGSYAFPSAILTEEHLRMAMDPDRLKRIRDAVGHMNDPAFDVKIYYSPEWHDQSMIEEESVDMIFSQAAMEHVDDLENGYKAMYRWLKRGGVMSHTIDFKCHGLATRWNGHWAYSDAAWKLLRGRLPYLINREPHSAHFGLICRNGFNICQDIRTETRPGIDRRSLHRRFKHLTDEDLTTSDAFILAVK